MVSVVHFTVNYFREQFFLMYYLESLPCWSSWGEKAAYFVKARGHSWIMLQMFTSSNFSLSLSVLLALRAEFYTHFICTHGTQINYKCEPSSKLFKDNLYCSLWSHLLSPTLNHTMFMHHIVLHFKLCAGQIGLYIYYIPFFGINIICLCQCVFMWVYMSVFLSMRVECVRAVNEKVNVQLHSCLSFIDSLYLLFPG